MLSIVAFLVSVAVFAVLFFSGGEGKKLGRSFLRDQAGGVGNRFAYGNVSKGLIAKIVAGLFPVTGLVPAGYVMLEDFDPNAGSGGNDQAAFASALADGRPLWLQAKTYNVTGGTAISGIFGTGDTSVLHTVTNAIVILVGASGLTFQNFRITGNVTPLDGQSQQAGIVNGGGAPGSGFGRTRIVSVTTDNLSSWGIIVQNQDTTNVGVHLGAMIIAHSAQGCGGFAAFSGGALLVGVAAEYVQCVAPRYNNNQQGLEIHSGNFAGSGSGSINDNITNGVHFLAGANDGHGQIYGWEINHSGSQSIWVEGTQNGFHFDTCHVIGGDLVLVSCVGFVFTSCQFDQRNYFFEGSIATQFVACAFGVSNANLVNNIVTLGVSPTTRWIDPTNTIDGSVPKTVSVGNDGSSFGGVDVPLASHRGAAAAGGTFVVTLVPGTDIPSNGAFFLQVKVRMVAGSPITDVADLQTSGAFSLIAGTAALIAPVAGSANPATAGIQVVQASAAGFGAATAVLSVVGTNIVLTVTDAGLVAATIVQVDFNAQLAA